MTERVVLAYSGGLDTSVGIGWIAEATGAEVIAVAVDVGQGGEDLEVIRRRALDCGAVEAYVADARDEFATEYCMPALQANGCTSTGTRWSRRSPAPSSSSTSCARPASSARTTVAHGCTGKGNDQVRFEVGITSLAPDLTCLAPVRDLALTRDKAIEFAEAQRAPDRDDQAQPVLDRPERLGPRGRDRLPRGHLERPDQGRLHLHRRPDVPAGRRRGRHHVRAGRARRARRRPGHAAAGDPGDEPPRRRPGRRPHRHRRGPPRRHQVPRGLRGPRCDRPHRGAPGARERHGRARAGPVQAGRRAALVRAGLRRPVVLPAEEVARRVRRRHAALRLRRRPDRPARRPRDGHRPPLGRVACTTSTSRRTTRATRSTRRPPEGFIEIYGLSSKLAAARDVRFGNGVDLGTQGGIGG